MDSIHRVIPHRCKEWHPRRENTVPRYQLLLFLGLILWRWQQVCGHCMGKPCNITNQDISENTWSPVRVASCLYGRNSIASREIVSCLNTKTVRGPDPHLAGAHGWTLGISVSLSVAVWSCFWIGKICCVEFWKVPLWVPVTPDSRPWGLGRT